MATAGNESNSFRSCPILLPPTCPAANRRIKCECWQMTDDSLRKAKSRLSHNEECSPHKNRPHSSLSRDDLIKALKASAEELHRAKQDTNRLVKARQERHTLSDNDEGNFNKMFSKLKVGLGEIDQRAKNPVF